MLYSKSKIEKTISVDGKKPIKIVDKKVTVGKGNEKSLRKEFNKDFPKIPNIDDKFNFDTSSVLEDYEIMHSMICFVQNRPLSEALDAENTSLNESFLNIPPQAQQLIAAKMLEFFIYIVTNKIARLAFKKFAIKEIRRNVSNEKIYNFLKTNIDAVYFKHKDYVPCTERDFRNSNMFERFAANFRDKKKGEIAFLIGRETLDSILDFLILPGFVPSYRHLMIAFGIPIKMALSLFGLSLKLGTVYSMVLTFEGKCVNMGLDLSPRGFRIVNLQLYSYKMPGHKMVTTFLPEIPDDLYLPSKYDLIDFFEKYPAKTIKEIKSEVEGLLE